MEINRSFKRLKSYCEAENFKGWDPYDGLNSKLFQLLPLKNWDLARLVWIQAFKRNPINLRKLCLIPREYNAKGIALFLSGYCNLYTLALSGDESFGNTISIRNRINELADLLLKMKRVDYSGACWGYNFDWQARRVFLFPKETPTVVATAFCASALYDAYSITQNEDYLETALSSAEFVVQDLKRTKYKSGLLFSYSPLNGSNTVFNASLLGAKILSHAYKYKKTSIYKDLAKSAVAAACDGQDRDGSWVYGLMPVQSWKDSFHTGYNLVAINTYQKCTGDLEYNPKLVKGFEYYVENFFEDDGTPKYYNNRRYPIDIHCPGQLIITLIKLGEFKNFKTIAQKVLKWSITSMQSKNGYFFYQKKRFLSSKVSYMRWSNAFMFNAISIYLKEERLNETRSH